MKKVNQTDIPVSNLGKKVNGKANRRKGHDFERKWAKTFRDLGYTYCKTSRLASKLLDDSKVDLAFIPFNVQCKNVQGSINYIEEINKVEEHLCKNFPPEDPQHNHPIIVIHRKGPKPEEELVVMRGEDFTFLLKKEQTLLSIIQELKNGNKN